MRLMKVDQFVDVDVTHAIAIRGHERFITNE